MNLSAVARTDVGEAIERLERMPEFVDAALESATPEELLFRPAPGEFALVEHVCHLRDLEREGYLVRVRRMLSEPAPALEGFDGTAVAENRHYLKQDARAAAQGFEAARRELTGILAALSGDDWERSATFGDERITLTDLVAMIVEHDREHRAQMESLKDQ